jgi:hypothetical protein
MLRVQTPNVNAKYAFPPKARCISPLRYSTMVYPMYFRFDQDLAIATVFNKSSHRFSSILYCASLMWLGWGSSARPLKLLNLPSSWIECRTFRLPPVIVTFTKRRVYTMRLYALPFGFFFFSCGSTWRVANQRTTICNSALLRGVIFCPFRSFRTYLWCLRLDFTGTSEGSVDFSHTCGSSVKCESTVCVWEAAGRLE